MLSTLAMTLLFAEVACWGLEALVLTFDADPASLSSPALMPSASNNVSAT